MVKPMEKKSFIKSGEGSVSTYEWTDVANGTGVVTFDGYALQLSGAVTTYYLGTNPPHSVPSSFGTQNATLAKDFYVSPFNTQRKIKGRMEFFYTQRITVVSGTITAQVTFTVKRYNASTATTDTLGSVIGFQDSDTINNIHMNGAYIDFSTEQKFKIGDQLIINVSLVAAGNGPVYFYHDPRNVFPTGAGGSGDEDTFFKVNVPFRIEL